VRVGSCFSDLYGQEMGVPLFVSVTLFLFKINGIVQFVPVGVTCSLYVGDFCVCCHSNSLIAIEQQQCLGILLHAVALFCYNSGLTVDIKRFQSSISQMYSKAGR